MRVLALTTYPVEAACTRFRVQQLVGPLGRLGVHLEVRPLLSAAAFGDLYRPGAIGRKALRLGAAHLRRLGVVIDARQADVVFLQREAAFLGPPVVEVLLEAVGRRPIVLDLDDATWISYDSPTYGRMSRLLKWPGKADWLIDHAALVTCGSHAIADHVKARGGTARLVPTVVDTNVFRPGLKSNTDGPPIVGWIGTHSTFPYLAQISSALAAAAETTDFRLLVVGAGDGVMRVDGIDVEQRPWTLEHEVADFRSLDVGLYPLIDNEWARGKSGFKAIQYLACGLPFVVSPIGATCDIGVPGVTHLEARTSAEWAEAVQRLVTDPTLRAAMGAAGRAHALERYSVPLVAGVIAEALRSVA